MKLCTAALWCCRSFILRSPAQSLYTSLIKPHFLYGCVHYDGSSVNAINSIQIAQNKALRAVMNVEPRYPTNVLHRTLRVPYIFDLCHYNTACFAYWGLYDISTPAINARYLVNNRAMGLRSESSVNFTRQQHRTTFGGKSVYQHSHTYRCDS